MFIVIRLKVSNADIAQPMPSGVITAASFQNSRFDGGFIVNSKELPGPVELQVRDLKPMIRRRDGESS
jgi:hypothetical protein